MSGRRSRHNKGRKPLYKEHRLASLPNKTESIQGVVAGQFVPGQPRYVNSAWLSTRCWWSAPERSALQRLVVGGYSPIEAADTLGRSPTSIVNYAKDKGIKLPESWGEIIARPVREDNKIGAIAYPYIIKSKPENADISEINGMVPRSIPSDMRGDICQEIMLAVLEGRVTLDDLRAKKGNAAFFIKKFYSDNFEQAGRAVSFGSDGDLRSYDEAAVSLAAKEWHYSQASDRDRILDFRRIYYPTQIADVFAAQVIKRHSELADTGLSLREVERLMDGDDL